MDVWLIHYSESTLLFIDNRTNFNSKLANVDYLKPG